VPRALAAALAAIVWLAPDAARAYENQWQVGAMFGYGLAGVPAGPAHGFGGGPFVTYGIIDYLNARLHLDVTGYDLPDPATTAFMWNAGAGFEVAFDVLRVVPYFGATVGPVDVATVDGDDVWHWGIEALAGLRFQITRNWLVGVEPRYRALLLGRDDSPMHNFIAVGSFGYAWGY
jgi:opacity protein-like surface antigen